MEPRELDVEALAELLRRTADRSVDAVERLRDDVGELRRVQDRDRDAWRRRCDRIETTVDQFARALTEVAEDVERLERDEHAALLVEQTVDGVTVTPARAGLDPKYVIGLLITILTAAIVPILVALLTAGGP